MPMTEATANERVNLLGLPKAELEAFVGELGSKPFRARQLMSWLYKRGEGDIAAMTDLAKDFRAQLLERAEVSTTGDRQDAGRLRRHAQVAAVGRQRPGLRDGLHPGGRPRHAVHLLAGRAARSIARSARPRSRASTATSPPPRSSARCGWPTASSESWAGSRVTTGIITNIVLMGMGEPLANFRNVVPAHPHFSRRPRLRPLAPPRDVVAPPASCRRSTSWPKK